MDEIIEKINKLNIEIVERIDKLNVEFYEKINEIENKTDKSKIYFKSYASVNCTAFCLLSEFLHNNKDNDKLNYVITEILSRLQYCLTTNLNADTTDMMDILIPIRNKISELTARKSKNNE